MKHSWRMDRDPSSQLCLLVMPCMFLLMVNTQVFIYYLHNIRKLKLCSVLDYFLCNRLLSFASWQGRCMGDWIIQDLHTVKMWSWDLASTRSLFLVPQWVFRWVSSVLSSMVFVQIIYWYEKHMKLIFLQIKKKKNGVFFQNVGIHFEKWNAGVLGPVTLKGLNEGTRDLTKQKWSYKVIS